MPAWSAVKRALFRSAGVAHCDATAPAAAGGDGAPVPAAASSQDAAAPSLPSKPAPKPKQYKPLPAPGSFQACDGLSQQILGVLHQQDNGAQVVVSKQMTPLLAVVHDFNIGIEQYIPKQMGASIYTFRAVVTNFAKTDTLSGQVDWFGRLNASYQHKWSKRSSSSIIAHISNSTAGEVTSVTAQTDLRGADFHCDAAIEATASPGDQDVAFKSSYMQSLTQGIAMGVNCKVGLMSGTTEAKLKARYTRGRNIFTGTVGAAVAAPGAPISLSTAEVTVSRQVTDGFALATRASYGLNPQTGQPDAKSETGWTYSFRDRMISGAVTTTGQIITQYMQMMGGMRWGLTVSHDLFKEGNNVGFGCLFEVMS